MCSPVMASDDSLTVEEMDRIIALIEKTQRDFYGPLLPMWDDQNGILERQQKYYVCMPNGENRGVGSG